MDITCLTDAGHDAGACVWQFPACGSPVGLLKALIHHMFHTYKCTKPETIAATSGHNFTIGDIPGSLFEQQPAILL